MKSGSILLFFLFLFLIFYLGKFIFLPLFLALFFYLVIKSVTNKLLISINSRLGVSLNKFNAMAIMLIIISILVISLVATSIMVQASTKNTICHFLT